MPGDKTLYLARPFVEIPEADEFHSHGLQQEAVSPSIAIDLKSYQVYGMSFLDSNQPLSRTDRILPAGSSFPVLPSLWLLRV